MHFFGCARAIFGTLLLISGLLSTNAFADRSRSERLAFLNLTEDQIAAENPHAANNLEVAYADALQAYEHSPIEHRVTEDYQWFRRDPGLRKDLIEAIRKLRGNELFTFLEAGRKSGRVRRPITRSFLGAVEYYQSELLTEIDPRWFRKATLRMALSDMVLSNYRLYIGVRGHELPSLQEVLSVGLSLLPEEARVNFWVQIGEKIQAKGFGIFFSRMTAPREAWILDEAFTYAAFSADELTNPGWLLMFDRLVGHPGEVAIPFSAARFVVISAIAKDSRIPPELLPVAKNLLDRVVKILATATLADGKTLRLELFGAEKPFFDPAMSREEYRIHRLICEKAANERGSPLVGSSEIPVPPPGMN